MADDRFYRNAGPKTLAELARVSGAELSDGSDPERTLSDVASIQSAGPDHLSFLDNKRYLPDFRASRAGACVVHPDHADAAPAGMALLLSKTPYRAYAAVAGAFYPVERPTGSVADGARVDTDAQIGTGTEVQAGAVIGPGAVIGQRCRIGANAVIGAGVEIGDDTDVGAGATLSHCLIGARVLIHPGVRIGQRGFGFDMSEVPFRDVPQLGRVIVEEDVEIGANSTVDRGAGPDTVIGAGCKLDNLVQIGHNVRLGRNCVLVAQVGVAGSAVLEDFVVLAGQSAVNGHVRVGKGTQVAAQSGVMRDVGGGERLAGSPAMPAKEFFRLLTAWRRIANTKGKTDE